jgi:DNA-binding MurR/RpiR family transcriptional regulator
MSKSFARIADFLLDYYIQTALMTATELAHQVDVDAATVVRFAQSLDYSGFPELQREVRDRVKSELLIRPLQSTEAPSISGVVDETLIHLREVVNQARILLDPEAVAEMVEAIGNARRIILLPESLGQAAAYNLLTLLDQGGFFSTVTPPGVTDLARMVSTASPEDMLLAIDIAGESPYIARALVEAKSIGIPTGAIVGAASLKSASVADIVLSAQNQMDIGLAIVMVDAVVYTLANALRWQYKDRFEGSSEAIETLFMRLQLGDR